MAAKTLKNVSVVFDGNTVTRKAHTVTINTTADKQEITAFGGDGYKEYDQGLKDGTVTVGFRMDYGADSVDAIIRPFFESGDAGELRIGPDGDVGADDNPIWVGEVKVFTYNFIDGAVGDVNNNSIEFGLVSAPTIDTT